MAIAGKRTEEREVPHEPGHTFTFRTISGPQLDEADIEGTKRSAEKLGVMPTQLMTMAVDEGRSRKAERDEFDGYSRVTLARHGIVSWRCPGGGSCGVCAGSYGDPPTPELINQLDAKTLEWAARQVYEMNVRPPGEATGSDDSSPIQKDETYQGS